MSGVAALALAGLLFPGHIFAKPAMPPGLASLKPDARLHIEVESMLADGSLPERFTVDIGDGTVYQFEYRQGGYAWWSRGEAREVRFQSLPSLDEVLSWRVEARADESFAASIPISALQPAPTPGVAQVAGAPAPFSDADVLEVQGHVDALAKRAQMTALGPSGELIDATVSFAGLPADIAFGGPWSAQDLDKYIIVISFSALLILLGVAVLGCLLIFTACQIACGIQCTYGVRQVVSAICGIGCTCDCYPPPKPDGPGCSGAETEVESLVFAGGGAPPLAESSFVLTRLTQSTEKHHGQPVSFLVGEWALVSWGGGKADVLGASSPAFAAAKRADLAAGGAAHAAAGRRTALVVEFPRHDANSRAIPLPAVRFADGVAPAGQRAGEVAVHARFDGARLLDLEVLHDTTGGVSPALRDQLVRSLSLELAGDDSHRVEVFAMIEVGDRVSLLDAVPFLPKCCCGDQFCI